MKNPILKNLAYFDVFQHPLKEGELVSGENKKESITQLKTLVNQQKCYYYKSHYSLQPAIKKLVEEREMKEKRAEHYFKKLPFFTRLIKRFPFVRGVAISGSLAKGVMHADGDIDYFIITSKNRLWICRTLLILFKKLVLLNSRKYFCINYLVDEDNLEIIDKNIFTAVEVSYLLPVYNCDLINKLKKKNNWSKNFYQFSHSIRKVSCYEGDSWIRSSAEQLINILGADQLDLFFMKLTLQRWSKKFKHFNTKKLELPMRTNRGVSKHHPNDFQTKVLEEYEKRLEKLTIRNEDTASA